MTTLDDFFTKPIESLHPLRNWKARLAESGNSATLEVYRPEADLGQSQPEMNLQFAKDGNLLTLETIQWDDDLNAGLIQLRMERVRTICTQPLASSGSRCFMRWICCFGSRDSMRASTTSSTTNHHWPPLALVKSFPDPFAFKHGQPLVFFSAQDDFLSDLGGLIKACLLRDAFPPRAANMPTRGRICFSCCSKFFFAAAWGHATRHAKFQ